MILDNKNILNKKSQITTVWEYLKKYTGGENLNIVSGFFTISALSLLKKFKEEPKKFRLILSEIAGRDDQKERIIDILQGNSDLSNAFSLQATAQKAIEILKQENVELRRIDNTFCHAKTYIYEADEADDCFFIAGSSNFTEKGIGYYKGSGNIEFNVARKGFDGDDFQGTLKWFEDIWANAAKDTVDVIEDAKKVRKTVKQYFIDCIENFCKEYMPRDIYYKILFELFHDDIELSFSDGTNRSITRLEDSVIWNVLFDYQKKGVRSLIAMLSKYNGAILADGVSIFENLKAWRSKIGYVSQNIYLLDDTVRNNIAFCREEDVDDEKVAEVMKTAQIFDFVQTLPKKEYTAIGEFGMRLSGGQRQRIAIARALYQQPELLILDEATSALDNETEKAFIDALHALKGSITIIMIAHRLSSLEYCDRTIALEAPQRQAAAASE